MTLLEDPKAGQLRQALRRMPDTVSNYALGWPLPGPNNDPKTWLPVNISCGTWVLILERDAIQSEFFRILHDTRIVLIHESHLI